MQFRWKRWQPCWASRQCADRAVTGGGWTIKLGTIRLRACLFVLTISLFFITDRLPLLAAMADGADPAYPLFPADVWLSLPDGASHWYAFRDEGDGTSIVVRMTVIPEQNASFSILTPDAVRAWARGEEFTAVGAGSAMKLFRNDLYWTGSFVQSGTYYVLVKSNRQGTSHYKITIDGSGVSFPLLSFAQPNPALAAPPEQYPSGNRLPPAAFTEEPASPAPGALSSVENPLPPLGKLSAIAGEDIHWYAFRDEGDASTIRVTADATPDRCLTFGVWTPEQLRLWQQGEAVRPVGEGTANPTLKADLFWTGSFVKSGVYYIVVRRNPAIQGACTYKLTALGDDVSLVMPTAP